MKAEVVIRWCGKSLVSLLLAFWAFYVGIGFAFSGKALSRLPVCSAHLLAWHPACLHHTSHVADAQESTPVSEDTSPKQRTISKIPLEDFFPPVLFVFAFSEVLKNSVYNDPAYLYYPTHILEIPAPPPWHRA